MQYGNITYQAIISWEDGSRYEYSSANLDCSFSIERSIMMAGSSAVVSINNIPKADYTKFFAPRLTFNRNLRGVMDFSLGREGLGLYSVFKKDIYEVITKREAQTTATTFTCMAGQFALSRVQTISTNNATLQTFLENYAKNNNLEIGKIDISNNVFDFHLPFSKGIQTLSQLNRAFPNLRIYIDNNKLFAVNKSNIQEQNASAGLVITSSQLKEEPKPSTSSNLIKIVTHLEPRAEVNSVCKLQSDMSPQFNGSFAISSVKHTGNISYTGNSTGQTEMDLLYLVPRG